VLEERGEVGVPQFVLPQFDLFVVVAHFHSSENRDSEAQHKTFFDFFAYKMRANRIRFRVQSSCQRHKKVCQWVKLRS
jgi:hypothetical protein